MTNTETVHNALTVTLYRIRDVITTVRAVCPDWEHSNDGRWAWFPGVKKVLILSQLHLELRMVYLGDSDWWTNRHPDFDPKDIPDVLNETEVLYKWWTLHQPYAQMEEALRGIAEVFDPTSVSYRTPIASISKNLCTKLGLEKHLSVFDLAHTIRNTIHNNGVFRPFDSKPKQISWKGQIYSFRPDDRIDFVTWEFVCDHIGDLADAMCDVVSSPEISSLVEVPRL